MALLNRGLSSGTYCLNSEKDETLMLMIAVANNAASLLNSGVNFDNERRLTKRIIDRFFMGNLLRIIMVIISHKSSQ